jgi:hypothetical protein
MELVLFKDLLEDDAEHQYGLLEDRDEPSVVCLCCGSEVEFGDYEIIERLPWQDFSSAVKQAEKSQYVVCMDSSWVRDSQMLDTSGLTDSEFNDVMYSDNDNLYRDMEPNPFIAIVEAASEYEACQKAAEQKRYDKRCLFAIKI